MGGFFNAQYGIWTRSSKGCGFRHAVTTDRLENSLGGMTDPGRFHLQTRRVEKYKSALIMGREFFPNPIATLANKRGDDIRSADMC